MEIHEKIKSIRKEMRLSQEVLACKLGLSQSQYSRRESGEIKWITDEINHLSKIFEIPASQLFEEEKTIYKNNNQKNDNLALCKAQLLEKDRIIEQLKICLEEKDEVIAALKREN